ncbi:MAG TPA: polysaccharide deacetylase family protein [bacterium]|nr:polysaccharide deacetylase family protein [bacterium]HPN45243.1 polysaccharide deacetylase family protein [bacterium]
MEHFCKNHPDHKARKKCRHCASYICSECEIDFLGSTYCSPRCLVRALAKGMLALLNIRPKTVTARRASIIHRLKLKSFRFVLDLVYIIILVFMLFVINNMTKELRQLRSERKQTIFSGDMLIPGQPLDAGFAMTGAPDAMVTSNSIDITGEAADSIILSIKVNGRLHAVTIPEDNKFIFQDIKLDNGANEIIVQGLDTHGNAAVLQRMVTFYGKPRLGFLTREFSRGNAKIPHVALTFDGGSGDGAAAEILDYLAEKKLKCTMFVTGAFLKRYPDLAKRMVREGHEVGNHTWSHPHLTTYTKNQKQDTAPGMTREKLQKQLNDTAELFEKITKKKMAPYWRAPYGEHNLEIRQWAAELGYRHVGWTVGNGENLDSHDWVADSTLALYKTPQQVMEKILNFGNGTRQKVNGGIVLMHLDTQRKQQPVHLMIPALVDSLRNRGYQLVKISEMIND